MMLQVSTKFGLPQSQAISSPTATSPQTPPIASHTFSINWENVLLPATWLATRMGVTTNVQTLQRAQQLMAQTPQLKTLMVAIEDNIIQLLTHAMAAGAVYIFSECTVQYVELSCSIFYPRLTACLRGATRGVFVVGVPDTSFSAEELAEWKVNILRTVCADRILAGQDLARAQSRRFGLIALCASDLDVHASDELSKVAPYAVTKSVKVAQAGATPAPSRSEQTRLPGSNAVSTLSLEDFSAQLQRLSAFVDQALAFNGAIRIAL